MDKLGVSLAAKVDGASRPALNAGRPGWGRLWRRPVAALGAAIAVAATSSSAGAAPLIIHHPAYDVAEATAYNPGVEPFHLAMGGPYWADSLGGVMQTDVEWASRASAGVKFNAGHTTSYLDFATFGALVTQGIRAEGLLNVAAGANSSVTGHFSVYSDVYSLDDGKVVSHFHQDHVFSVGPGEFLALDVLFSEQSLVALVPVPGSFRPNEFRWAQGITFDYAYTGNDAYFEYDFYGAYDTRLPGAIGGIAGKLVTFPYDYNLPEPGSAMLALLALALMAAVARPGSRPAVRARPAAASA